jgi:hypothetical protein
MIKCDSTFFDPKEEPENQMGSQWDEMFSDKNISGSVFFLQNNQKATVRFIGPICFYDTFYFKSEFPIDYQSLKKIHNKDRKELKDVISSLVFNYGGQRLQNLIKREVKKHHDFKSQLTTISHLSFSKNKVCYKCHNSRFQPIF